MRQYARFGVPIYLIIDPFLGQCTLLTRPKGDSYASRDEYTYGETITLRLGDEFSRHSHERVQAPKRVRASASGPHGG